MSEQRINFLAGSTGQQADTDGVMTVCGRLLFIADTSVVEKNNMNSTSGDIQRKKSLNRFIGRFFWGNSFYSAANIRRIDVYYLLFSLYYYIY